MHKNICKVRSICMLLIGVGGMAVPVVAMQKEEEEPPLCLCSVCQEPVFASDASTVYGTQVFAPCVKDHAHHDAHMAQLLAMAGVDACCPYCRSSLRPDGPVVNLAPLTRAVFELIRLHPSGVHHRPVSPTRADLEAMAQAVGIVFAPPPVEVVAAVNLPFAFFVAVNNDELERVQQLVAQGADVNWVQPESGKTALIMAVQVGDVAMVRWLIREGHANCNVRDTAGYTALMYAARNGRADVVHSLFDDGHIDVDQNLDALALAHYNVAIVGEFEYRLIRHNNPASSALMRDMPFAAARDGVEEVMRHFNRYESVYGMTVVDGSGFTPLMYAAQNGHMAVVRDLIEYGDEVLLRNNAGLMARDLAMAKGHTEVADFLAQHEPQPPAAGAGPVAQLLFAARTRNIALAQEIIAAHPLLINMRDDKGRTALMFAAIIGDEVMTRFLIAHGANLEACDYRDYRCALTLAIMFRHFAIVKILVEEGDASLMVEDCDGDEESVVEFARGYDDEIYRYLDEQKRLRGGVQPRHVHIDHGKELREAANKGDIAQVMQLARAYPDLVNEPDDSGETALFWAIGRDCLGVVRCLVNTFHADVTVRNHEGRTARDHAIAYGKQRIVNFFDVPSATVFAAVASGDCEQVHQLIAHEADVDAVQPESGKTALIMAAEVGNTAMVQLLIGEGHANCDVRDAQGFTALMYAVRNDHIGVVRALFKDGHVRPEQNIDALVLAYRNAEIVDLFGYHGGNDFERGQERVFFAAARDGVESVVHYFIRLGSMNGLTIVDEAGFTPLMHAAQGGHLAIVRTLVEHGNDVLLRNNAGLTARDLALVSGQADVADFLAQHAPRPPASRDGLVAQLLFAAHTKNLKTVQRIIIKHPMLINMRDSQGRTPLICAVLAGDEAMVRFLIAHGANIEAYDYKNFSSALVCAIEFRKPTIVRILTEEGHASFEDAMDNDGDFVRVDKFAREWGYEEIAQYLAAQRVARRGEPRRPTPTDFGELLRQAADCGDCEIVAQLVGRYPELTNEPDDEGNTAFFKAFSKDYADVMHLLAPHADVNCKDRRGDTVLLRAARYADVSRVRYLVKDLHADVTIQDEHGHTAREVALERGQHDIVAFFDNQYVEHVCPASTSFINCEYRCTSIMKAIDDDKEGLVRSLAVDLGIDLEKKYNGFRLEREIPLLYAVRLGKFGIVRCLVNEAHANPNIGVETRETAYDVALRSNHPKIAAFLAEHGGMSAASLVHVDTNELRPLLATKPEKGCCTVL